MTVTDRRGAGGIYRCINPASGLSRHRPTVEEDIEDASTIPRTRLAWPRGARGGGGRRREVAGAGDTGRV
jgi:hypothetical protein